MGLRWYKQVWADETLRDKPASHRLAMLALAEFANDDTGQCWPSIETLSTMICLQDRQTQRVLKSLSDDGYIAIEVAHGRTRSNVYTIIEKGVIQYTPAVKKVSSSTPLSKRKGVTHDIKGVTHDIKGVLDDTQTIIEPSIEPSKTTTTSGCGADEWKIVQSAYENNIGMFTQITSELAQEAIQTYGATAIVAAITEAARHNVRKWAYVDGVLRKWHANGGKATPVPSKSVPTKPRFVNGKEQPPEGMRVVNVHGEGISA